MDAVTLNPTRLALAAVIGLIILLVLIIRFHARICDFAENILKEEKKA